MRCQLQPEHQAPDRRWPAGHLGDDRAAYQTPYAEALRSGINITSTSDAPNVSPDWRVGLQTAMLRQGISGAVSGADQRIGFRAALATYTTAAAWQDRDDRKGGLSEGMVGDVCVLDGELVDERGELVVPATDLSGIGVAMTVVGGEVVYSAEDTLQRCDATAMVEGSWATNSDPGSMCSAC